MKFQSFVSLTLDGVSGHICVSAGLRPVPSGFRAGPDAFERA
jgi:hypothetical protein